jgi:hypothetical protein
VARFQTWRWQCGCAARLAARGVSGPFPSQLARDKLTADAAAALAALAARLAAGRSSSGGGGDGGGASGSGSGEGGAPFFFFGAAPSSLDAFAIAQLSFILHAPTVRARADATAAALMPTVHTRASFL